MTKTVIVKVQRPLFFSEGAPHELLIYAKGRRGSIQRPPTKEEEKKISEHPKQFFFAEQSQGDWILKGGAPWQDW